MHFYFLRSLLHAPPTPSYCAAPHCAILSIFLSLPPISDPFSNTLPVCLFALNSFPCYVVWILIICLSMSTLFHLQSRLHCISGNSGHISQILFSYRQLDTKMTVKCKFIINPCKHSHPFSGKLLLSFSAPQRIAATAVENNTNWGIKAS